MLRMKISPLLCFVALTTSPSAIAQTDTAATQVLSRGEQVSYSDLLSFDTNAHTLPESKRDDFSQCEGEDVAGMLRAVRECWPVYESYRKTQAFREARIPAVALVNDIDADLDVLDAAQTKVLKEALLVSQAIPEPRYPAQFEIAVIAHAVRFNEFSRKRQFQRALDDTNQLISFYHKSKVFRETGLHLGVLHISRVDMNLALERPASESMIDRPNNARSIQFSDLSGDFLGMFIDKEQHPPTVLALGVDPARATKPDDCNGRDYAGLLGAILYCAPILELYENTKNASLYEFSFVLDNNNQIEAQRILLRAAQIDSPAADFFALIALISQSVGGYAADDAVMGKTALASARKLIETTELELNGDILTRLKDLPIEVKKAMAQLKTKNDKAE